MAYTKAVLLLGLLVLVMSSYVLARQLTEENLQLENVKEEGYGHGGGHGHGGHGGYGGGHGGMVAQEISVPDATVKEEGYGHGDHHYGGHHDHRGGHGGSVKTAVVKDDSYEVNLAGGHACYGHRSCHGGHGAEQQTPTVVTETKN